MKSHWTRHLESLGACSGAIEWCRQFRTPGEAWKALSLDNHRHQDWYTWILFRLGGFTRVELFRFVLDHGYIFYDGSTAYRYVPLHNKSQFPTPTVTDLKMAIKWRDNGFNPKFRPWVRLDKQKSRLIVRTSA